MREKLPWLGTLVAIVTIVGSILLGGVNFGSVKATVNQHELRLTEIGERITGIDDRTQSMEIMTERIATDLSWIKLTLMEMREINKNGTVQRND